jgi:hypothetical protein
MSCLMGKEHSVCQETVNKLFPRDSEEEQYKLNQIVHVCRQMLGFDCRDNVDGLLQAAYSMIDQGELENFECNIGILRDFMIQRAREYQAKKAECIENINERFYGVTKEDIFELSNQPIEVIEHISRNHVMIRKMLKDRKQTLLQYADSFICVA